MTSPRYSDELIIEVLTLRRQGIPLAELIRLHGFSEETFFRWQARYDGLDLRAMQRCHQLEQENRQLQRRKLSKSLGTKGSH